MSVICGVFSFLWRNKTLNKRLIFLQDTVQSLVKQHMPKKVGDKITVFGKNILSKLNRVYLINRVYLRYTCSTFFIFITNGKKSSYNNLKLKE